MDDNPINDELCNILNVVYSTDVSLEITTPEPKADVILYEQAEPGESGWSNAWTSDTGAGYLVQEDFPALTGSIGTVMAYGMPLICCWSAGDETELVFDVMFSEQSTPSTYVYNFQDIVPEELIYLWTYGGAYPAWGFRLKLPSSAAMPNGGWCGVQTNGANTWYLWINSPDGDNDAMQNGASLGYNTAFQLIKGGLSFTPEVWVGIGEQDFCATVTNEGTFDIVDDPATPCDFEGIVVTYNISMYVPPECPDCQGYMELLTEGSINLELPCGESDEVCFTYDFTACGIYVVSFEAILPVDCVPDDNIDNMVIGVDICDPIAAHTTTPAEPDGCNNWYTSDVKVKITAEDSACDCDCPMSELATIHYILNDGTEVVKNKSPVEFTITTEGVNLVEYWAVDNAGNEGDHHIFQVAIDKTKPTVDLIYEKIEDGTLQIKFTAVASDATSGVQKVEFSYGTFTDTIETPPFVWIVTWDASMKTQTFKAKVYDGACLTAEDTIFGGDIPTAKAFFDSLAQNRPLSQALSQDI
jgi:hypothetical protein